MRRILLAAVASACLAGPVMAQDASHIRSVVYSPTRRENLVGVVHQPTTITFPPFEDVIRIVQTSGKDDGQAAWQIPTKDELDKNPLGNNLPLWPVEPGTTFLTVITRGKDGVERPYAFRLVARADAPGAVEAADVTFNLLITSPDEVRKQHEQAQAHLVQVRQAAAQRTARDRLRIDPRTSDGICHYMAQGQRPNVLTPPCPTDNGEWTRIVFPGLTSKPAVYVVDPADLKSERLARQHADGDAVIVEEIAPRLRLRLGSYVLDLINTAYDPAGKPANTGTVSPDVVRRIIQASAR